MCFPIVCMGSIYILAISLCSSLAVLHRLICNLLVCKECWSKATWTNRIARCSFLPNSWCLMKILWYSANRVVAWNSESAEIYVRIRHLQVATRVVTYTRYSCYERWFTYINPCQLESSRKTSGNVKLVNWTKENRKSRAENRLENHGEYC